jgi:hypothetical protein
MTGFGDNLSAAADTTLLLDMGVPIPGTIVRMNGVPEEEDWGDPANGPGLPESSHHLFNKLITSQAPLRVVDVRIKTDEAGDNKAIVMLFSPELLDAVGTSKLPWPSTHVTEIKSYSTGLDISIPDIHDFEAVMAAFTAIANKMELENVPYYKVLALAARRPDGNLQHYLACDTVSARVMREDIHNEIVKRCDAHKKKGPADMLAELLSRGRG